MKARLTPDIRLDTVFAPFHWGGGASANALTNPALDPVSRIPEFKVCAVRVEKVAAPGVARAQAPASTFSQ
jgi:assimilatory nitrate reductase catalytic subunit